MATKLNKAEKQAWYEVVGKLSNALYAANVCQHIDIVSFCQFFDTQEEFISHCSFYMKKLR